MPNTNTGKRVRMAAQDKKKELEAKILKFLQSEIYHRYLKAPSWDRQQFRHDPSRMAVAIREIYLAVDTGSYGAADVFNSVLGAMHKAGMIFVQENFVHLCQDLKLEAIEKAEKVPAA